MVGIKLNLCAAISAGTCFRSFERLGECSFEVFPGKANQFLVKLVGLLGVHLDRLGLSFPVIYVHSLG